MVFKFGLGIEKARPYLNRICSIGSYLCILEFKGDRIPSLVDELRLCDQSVITDLVAPSWAILIAEDRSQLALAAGMVT
ncbi:hypothetical protein V6N13_060954 [Hibiscus sabdariffa]|uniref:Uncharacterized protein n=1 Tax=Hibiscus sabdariffa TaxID=183260 RepID=A0ABR2AZ22_9ROSI